LFTLLSCDENVVDLFDTLQFLCIQQPFVVDETILTHSYKVSELNLIPKFEPANYILLEFAFNLFQMKEKKLEKEEKDKLVFLLILHLLLKDVDVKHKEHLRKFSFQVLELTVKQKHQVEQIDVSKQFDINVINAVLTYWQNIDDNFLQLIKEDDDPIQLFHLIKYLKLNIHFPTTKKYIKTYLTTTHASSLDDDSLLEDDSFLEEDTMTKLAYLLFINKNKLSVKTIENIINKACDLMKSTESSEELIAGKHLITVILLFCPTITGVQKARLEDQIEELEEMYDENECNSDNESENFDWMGYDEYHVDELYDGYDEYDMNELYMNELYNEPGCHNSMYDEDFNVYDDDANDYPFFSW